MKRLLSIIAIAVMAIVSAKADDVVASIGGNTYTSISAAMDALQTNETLTLEADINLGEGQLMFEGDGNNYTLYLNNHNLTSKSTPIVVCKGVELYIQGDGILTSNYDVVNVEEGACMIYGGTYIAGDGYGSIYLMDGYGEINGGFHKGSLSEVKMQEDEISELYVYRGYFSEKVPEEYFEYDVTDNVANEDEATKAEYPWVVCTAVASIGEVLYDDFPTAIAALTDGDVLVLESNVTMDDCISFEGLAEGEYTIDLNGHWVESSNIDGTLYIGSKDAYITVNVTDSKKTGYLANTNPEGCVVFVDENDGFYADGGSFYTAAENAPVIAVNDGSFAEIYGGNFSGNGGALFSPDNADVKIYSGAFNNMEVQESWLGENCYIANPQPGLYLVIDPSSAIKPVLFNNKSKAVKTYENGHIVIVKEDGSKFDLAGRRLK